MCVARQEVAGPVRNRGEKNPSAPDAIPSSPSRSRLQPKREPEDGNSALLSSTAMPDDDRGSLMSIQSLHASPDSVTSKSVSSRINLKVGELAVDA